MKKEEALLKFIQQNDATTIDVLAIKLNISRQYVHIIVKKLVESGDLTKMGTAPHVFYTAKKEVNVTKTGIISYAKEQFLNQHFLIVDALGNKLQGLVGMQYWCENQNLDLSKTVDEFIETRNKYLAFYNEDYLINGLQKLQNTKGMGELGVDELYYLDFYAVERFGKTQLGCLMHYAKQGQNKNLMKLIVHEIKNRIQVFITTHHINAVLFVPPTIKRKVQIMDYFEKELKLNLPSISVKKN